MSASTFGATFIEETVAEFRRYCSLVERAIAQVDDGAFNAVDPVTGDAIATYVKHMGGNLLSRWSNFLTSDGEKPNRNRDGEFLLLPEDTRDSLMDLWSRGWTTLFDTLASLTPDDLAGSVTIRSEPQSVIRAMQRSLAHAAYHTGQIVLLAKRAAGNRWQTLSIPRGGSEAFARELKERMDEESAKE